ncbi:HAD-IB family hydrolase [Streptomyces sp. ARC32]
MFDFLRFRVSAEEYATEHGRLRAMARAGVDRTEVNRAYYRLYAGTSWHELMEQGRAWYAAIRHGGRVGAPFIASGLQALRGHRDAGHRIALVSGSFLPCLQPFADEIGADLILCTEPLLDRSGRLTGEVGTPMIGEAKAAAARKAIADAGTDPTDCFAYGDHASDLPLLLAVGSPAVVGGDEVLLGHAGSRGWPVLPAGTEPLAAADVACGCGCAVAAWSMPETAEHWMCGTRIR